MNSVALFYEVVHFVSVIFLSELFLATELPIEELRIMVAREDQIIQKTFDVTLTDRQEDLRAHRFQFQSGIYNNIHVTIILQNC